ncbi:hypothetical protein EV360DRAFT_73240 [Lentinula raphanica]|nr:hypothetical protein EV360DRAFT_73240 [Lentinula raphanica]
MLGTSIASPSLDSSISSSGRQTLMLSPVEVVIRFGSEVFQRDARTNTELGFTGSSCVIDELSTFSDTLRKEYFSGYSGIHIMDRYNLDLTKPSEERALALSDYPSSLLSRPFKEITAATASILSSKFKFSIELKLSPDCTMRYFSLSIATSVITSPCLSSLLGNGTAVGAMEHHIQPQAIDRAQQKPDSLPRLLSYFLFVPALDELSYHLVGQFIGLYITDLDSRTHALTPRSAVFLGNNPDDYARSGKMFRRRDPQKSNPIYDDDPRINDPQPTTFRQVGLLRQLTSSRDANTLLYNIRQKHLPTNSLYCAAVFAEIIFGGYLLSLSDDWLDVFYDNVIFPNRHILSVDVATFPQHMLPPPFPLLGLPSPYSNTEHPDA